MQGGTESNEIRVRRKGEIGKEEIPHAKTEEGLEVMTEEKKEEDPVVTKGRETITDEK